MHSLFCLAAVNSIFGVVLALGQVGDLGRDVAQLQVRHRTEHYRLSGTVSDKRFAEYGRCLEFIHNEYAKGFAELVARPVTKAKTKPPSKSAKGEPANTGESSPEPSGDEGLFPVVIFATDDEYQEFGGRYFGGRAEHTRGLYVPAVKLLLIRDETDSADTYEVLFHEAFHQFMHRSIPAAPVWINEGLATYYGTARVTPSGLAFDRPRSPYANIVASAVSARQVIPLQELMTMPQEAFYSSEPVPKMDISRTTLCYAQAYTLVAYVLADPEGCEHLRRYLRDLASAKDHAAAVKVTRRAFPDSLIEKMVTEWLQFVNRN